MRLAQGRKYDARRRLRSWWTPEDVASFRRRAGCIRRLYSSFRVGRQISPLAFMLSLLGVQNHTWCMSLILRGTKADLPPLFRGAAPGVQQQIALEVLLTSCLGHAPSC